MTDEERLARYEHGADVLQRFLAPHGQPRHEGLEDFIARVNEIRDLLQSPDRDLARLASETLTSLRELAWPEEKRAFAGKIGEKGLPVPSDPEKRALMLRVREMSADRSRLGRALEFLRSELDREQIVRRVAAELVTERVAMRAVAENALLRRALITALREHPALDAPIRNAQIARIFREAGMDPVLRTAADMTKAELLRLKGMGPCRYKALLAELGATGLALPHLLRGMSEVDPAPIFVEEGVTAEVDWDPLGSPLNRELDARLERLLTAGGLPGGVFDMGRASYDVHTKP